MTAAAVESHLAQVRRFNRHYTQALGLLDEKILDSSFTLTQVRVLQELRRREPVGPSEVSRRLGLDPGRLSRLLADMAGKDLVSRDADPSDGRRQLLRLTETGRAAFDRLDRGADDQIRSLLAHLEPERRRVLAAKLESVRRMLNPDDSARRRRRLRALEPGDLGWIVSRHGALYAAERGWDVRFEGMVAQIVADFAASCDSSGVAGWIAELDGEPAGSVMCTRDDASCARLRVLLTEPWARGAGVGTALVDACVDFARDAGYRRMTLTTVAELTAAVALYRRAGFALDRSRTESRFGALMTVQDWSRDL